MFITVPASKRYNVCDYSLEAVDISLNIEGSSRNLSRRWAEVISTWTGRKKMRILESQSDFHTNRKVLNLLPLS